jgi:hypothetical protein
MPCFDFLEGLEGLLGLTSEEPLKPDMLEPDLLDWEMKPSVGSLLPEELVNEIMSFVPVVVQEARYTTEIAGPKGVDVSFSGKYNVTFKGDVCVGGKANVHLSVTDERTDGLTKFDSFDCNWITEVIDITEEGVHLARGDFEENSYTIKQQVVCGRLLKPSSSSICVPRLSSSFSSESEMPRRILKRSASF